MGWLRGQDGCPCQSFDLPELLAEETEARAHILRSLVGLVTLLTPGGLGPVLADVGEAQASFLLSLLFKQGDQWRRTQLPVPTPLRGQAQAFLSLFFSGNLRPPQLKSPLPPAHSGPWAAHPSVFASRLVNTLLQVLTERGRHFWRFGLGDLQASPLPCAVVRWVSPGAAPQRGGGCWKAGLCLDQQQEGGGHVHCPSEDTRKGS